MDPGLALRGFLMAFAIAAAVGPITLLVVRRTLGSGWSRGLASGLGVATADAAYGAVAAFGIAVVADLLLSASRPLGILGGSVLLAIDITTAVRPAPPAEAVAASGRGLLGAYLSMVALTLTNPMTIVLYGAVIVSVGIPASSGAAASLWVGLALGSVAWWLVLVPAVALVRGRLSPGVIRAVTIASGLAIAGFGAITLVSALLG